MRSRLSRKEQQYLSRARVCRVASVDGGGAVHVAPLCHAFDAARRTAYVWTEGRTARNLRTHPRGALVCDDYFEDWDRIRGVVARVRAEEIRSGAALDRARRLMQEKFKQYRGEEIDAVLALRVEAVTSWGL